MATYVGACGLSRNKFWLVADTKTELDMIVVVVGDKQDGLYIHEIDRSQLDTAIEAGAIPTNLQGLLEAHERCCKAKQVEGSYNG